MRRARPYAYALAGGVTGTAVMTAALAIETKLEHVTGDDVVDYDDSDHVVIAACRVLHIAVPDSEAGRKALFNLVHWGYGSSVGLAYVLIRRRTRSDVAAGAVFLTACQAMAMTLFPTLGDTPPPWRWRRGVVVSSVACHTLYVASVATVFRRLSRRL